MFIKKLSTTKSNVKLYLIPIQHIIFKTITSRALFTKQKITTSVTRLLLNICLSNFDKALKNIHIDHSRHLK